MFSDQLKNDLNKISAQPNLLSRTRTKIAEARIRDAHTQAEHAAKTAPRGYRTMRIAAAVLCPVIILSGIIYIWTAQHGAASQQNAAFEKTNTAAETSTAMDTLASTAPENSFRDSGIQSFSSYDPIIQLIQKSLQNTVQKDFISNSGELDGKVGTTIPMTTDQASNDMANPNSVPPENTGSNYSQTNVQVAGVDEADVIKNDGSYIFCMIGQHLYVVDVRDPQNMQIAADLVCSDNDSNTNYLDMFFDSDTRILTVISNVYAGYTDVYGSGKPLLFRDALVERSSANINAPACYAMPSQTYTKMETYDMSDPFSPKPVRTFAQEGNYVSSRRIADTVYLVTSQSLWYETGASADDLLPGTSSDEQNWTTVPAKDIYIVNPDQADMYTIVSAVDSRNTDNAPVTQAVIGSGSMVYASADTLYVAGVVWNSAINETTGPDSSSASGAVVTSADTYSTKLLSFSIADGKLEAKAACTIAGTILNSYSMDEYQGYLRVATTTGGWPGESSNNVIVLNKDLKEVSSLSGLAPGEQIYSARFAGDRIYLVTFVQVDPLFVIDASNPTELKVLGELKIPGFSNYLQILDDNKVLAIGNATRSEGENVIPAGLKIAVFDVTDPKNPIVQSSLVYGESYGYSEVQNNPKALLLDLSRGLIGLPVSFDKNAGKYGSDFVEGFLLLNIDTEGNLSHRYIFDDVLSMYGGGRGVYIGDALFLVGNSEISAYSITSYQCLDTLAVELQPITNYPPQKTFLPD